MGLTYSSSGSGANKTSAPEFNGRRILFAGNPNVGKSTLFNSLTGLHQHTGNWTGKTVLCAYGKCKECEADTLLIDLPGCYSLNSRSEEERVARDEIYFSEYEKAVIVCDASCLERHLFLAYQILEIAPEALICVNLADEAERKGVSVDAPLLSELTGVPCILTSAKKKGDEKKLSALFDKDGSGGNGINYGDRIEGYIASVCSLLIGEGISRRQARAFALRALDGGEDFVLSFAKRLSIHPSLTAEIRILADNFIASAFGGNAEALCDAISAAITARAEKTARQCTVRRRAGGGLGRADKLLTGRFTAFPVMLALLFFILFLTVKGANYPSDMLRRFFDIIENGVCGLLTDLAVPTPIVKLICEGMIRITGWVISVMLPPMAIFFPLFTLLEDIGYLPRMAFNLDCCFKGCGACGKQSLTMCMGLGCNAAGVVGCRIIDSRRERDIALLTNAFMPCNGRFPMLITVIGIFFASSGTASAVILLAVIVIAVLMTLLVSKLLSSTLLRGVPSSFTLELPSFRMPNIKQVLIRSVIDRTLFVLGRAVAVALPAGAVIWLLSNTVIGDSSVIGHLSRALDPIGAFIGLDGVILLAFILGLPANEIVIPIILMCYVSGGALSDHSSLQELGIILKENGWTALTAVNFLIFTVFHWPCSTTVLTVKKETGSIKKTLAAVIIPTLTGVTLCLLTRLIFSII